MFFRYFFFSFRMPHAAFCSGWRSSRVGFFHIMYGVLTIGERCVSKKNSYWEPMSLCFLPNFPFTIVPQVSWHFYCLQVQDCESYAAVHFRARKWNHAGLHEMHSRTSFTQPLSPLFFLTPIYFTTQWFLANCFAGLCREFWRNWECNFVWHEFCQCLLFIQISSYRYIVL